MNEFIKAMEEGLFLDIETEHSEKTEEVVCKSESLYSYWYEMETFHEEDQEIFNECIYSWENKHFSRKYERNSRFKNKLRDKAYLLDKLYFYGGKINKKFIEKGICNVDQSIPFYNGVKLTDRDSSTVHSNAKEYFFGRLITSRRTLNGVPLGYRWHREGSRTWKKAEKKVKLSKEKEFYKAEIATGITLFEQEFFGIDSLNPNEVPLWHNEHPDYYDFETDIVLPENKDATHYWEESMKFRDVSELIEEQNYLNFDDYQEELDFLNACFDEDCDNFDHWYDFGFHENMES